MIYNEQTIITFNNKQVHLSYTYAYTHTHTHSEQELSEVDAFGGPYQRHATAQNTHVTESARGI